MQKSKTLIISIIVMSFLCGTISTQYKYSKEVNFQALNATPKTSQPDGTLEFATYLQPVTIDPIDQWDSGSGDVIRQVTETLFWNNYSNPSLAVEPLLVESFSWDITNTYLTLILKQGIYFHDGHELDAAAVKWNVDRWLYFTNATGGLPSGTPVAYPSNLYFFPDNTPIIFNCSINGAYNLTIALTQPFGPFIEFLGFEANSIISPFSHSPTEYIDLYTGDLIGTGPFTFTYFIPNIEVKFERFDDYWRGTSEIETLIFEIVTDFSTRNNMLLAKDVHIINGYDNALLPTFVADPDIHVELLGTDLNYWSLGFNNLMINGTWREALSYAFNYTYVTENILNGEADRGCPAVPQAMPGHNASVQANLPTMDIPYARSIMQSMGFGVGWDTTYLGVNEAEWTSASFATTNFLGPLELNAIEGNARNADINSLASNMWQLIGVDTIEIERTFVDFLNIAFNTPNDLHVWYLGWAPDFLEAYNMLNPLFNPNSDSNFGQVNIPAVNSLLSDAAIETDIPTRLAIYEQLQYILFLQEFVHMPLFANIQYAVHLTTLLDFPYTQANVFYFYPCSILHLGPGSFTLTSDAEDPDQDGSFTLNWTEAEEADNYTIYSHSSYINEINYTHTIVESGITNTNLTLNNFPSGTHFFIVEAVNEEGTTLSNCIEIDVLVISLNKRSPIYDGLFLNYSASVGSFQYGVITASYTHISGNTFLVNESLIPTHYASYEINNQTRQITDIGYTNMFSGDYTPYWIFSNQSIGDLMLIAVDGEGDHIFNITSETTINLPGIKNFNAWVLKDLSEPNTNVLYDKTTGILLYGTFFYSSGTHNYTMTLDATNMFESTSEDPPGSFILSSNAGTPDDNGNFDLSWTASDGALSYSVYQYSSYITEINGSLTLLGDGITDLSLALSGYTDGTYYFIAVAHNTYGDTLSNCIVVIVQIQGIPGYNLYFIFAAIGIISAITIRKRRKKRSEY